jgi:hypothetical protein
MRKTAMWDISVGRSNPDINIRYFYFKSSWSVRINISVLILNSPIQYWQVIYGLSTNSIHHSSTSQAHATRKFIIAFTSVRYESRPLTLNPTYLKIILQLCSHLRLSLPSSLFPIRFLTKILHTFLISTMRAICPIHIIPSRHSKAFREAIRKQAKCQEHSLFITYSSTDFLGQMVCVNWKSNQTTLITYNDSSEVINPVISWDEGQITAKMAGKAIISNIRATLRRFPSKKQKQAACYATCLSRLR